MTFKKFGTPVKQEATFEIKQEEVKVQGQSIEEAPEDTQEETPTN